VKLKAVTAPASLRKSRRCIALSESGAMCLTS
jgi:hypothetical protein